MKKNILIFLILFLSFGSRLFAQTQDDFMNLAYQIALLPESEQQQEIDRLVSIYATDKANALQVRKALNVFVGGISVFFIKKDKELEQLSAKMLNDKLLFLYEVPYLDDPFANNVFKRLGEEGTPSVLPDGSIKVSAKFNLTPITEDYKSKSYKVTINITLDNSLKKALPNLESELNNKIVSALGSTNTFSNLIDAKSAYINSVKEVFGEKGIFDCIACLFDGHKRAAYTFYSYIKDLGGESEVKDIGDDVLITGTIPMGDYKLQIKKIFEKKGSLEEYSQFLKNWKVDLFDATIFLYPTFNECCEHIRQRSDEILEKQPPFAVALLADVLMGAPGTIYGWYTGDHWRTGQKLETWEQILGILDVIPGEVLIKAGVVAVVTTSGVIVFKTVIKAAKVLFKVGDEIAGIAISRIKLGSNGKIAVIGRAMGNEDVKGVRDVYKELVQKGYNVEIFDKLSLKGKWYSDFVAAEAEMADLIKNNNGKWLDNNTLLTTKMYKLNKEWADMLVKEGYEVIDMGDIYLKADDYRGFSLFYAMEKSLIFK